MTRKDIFYAWIILMFGVIGGAVLVAASPVWFIVLMFQPRMLNQVSEFIMRNMTKQMVSMMLSHGKTPIGRLGLCGVSSTGLST